MTYKKGYTTKSVHTKFPKKDAYNALHMPIYDGVAYEFESSEEIEEVFLGEKSAHVYSRTSNPTVEYFEHKLKSITGAYGVIALSSGMAAISNTLLSLVEPGGNIVSSNHLFGHTYAFLKNTLTTWGIEVRFVNMCNIEEVEKSIDEKTRVLFFETITNPQLEVVDIAQLTSLAHAKNVAVVTDSTLTPPYVFKSVDFGVDIEVMSSTKFISGGASAIGGVVIDNGIFDWSKLPALKSWDNKFKKDALIVRIRKEIFRHLGGNLTAHMAHYLNMGLDILALRVDRCVETCLALSDYFKEHEKVVDVNYPAMKNHPSYQLSQEQFSGKPGAVMTIDLKDKKSCFDFMDALNLVRRATNLNDNKTLVIHPCSTIYSEFEIEEKVQMDVRDTMLRLSVGIEDVEDLIEDFQQAFAEIK